jgi:Ankyrin repeats (3 copies)
VTFESAVDAVITGDVATLESLLRANPGLARARSTHAHRATLLHYIAANGVENFRQQTPSNAVDVAKILLDAGAEVDALAEMYGGGATTMDMLVSSVHPVRAGVQVALVETLLDFGATINGPSDNGSPLMTALAFHYPGAADALARRGARVDNILAAAGLGSEALVVRFIDDDRRPAVRWPRVPNDPRSWRELALIWAAGFGHTGVVDLLLEHGVDLRAKDQQGFTALHNAAFYGHLATVDLLLRWNASLDVENVYGGTVLGSTIWASEHAGLGVDHAPIIARLTRATGSTG